MIQLDRAEYPEAHISGEQRLFLNVILSAAREALGRLQGGDDRSRGAKSQRLALDWFRAADDNFQAVCLFAGLDPCCVRSGVLAYVDGELSDASEQRTYFASKKGAARVH